MSDSYQTEFNLLKKDFYNKTEVVLVIKRESKRRTLNPDNIVKYKRDILNSYNAFVKSISEQWSKLTTESQEFITKSTTESYHPRLVDALNYIGFGVDLPTNFAPLDANNVQELAEGATGGSGDSDVDGTDVNGGNGDNLRTIFVDDFGPNAHKRTQYAPQKTEKGKKTVGFSSFRDPKYFDQKYSLDPRQIAANRTAARSNNASNQNFLDRNVNADTDDENYDHGYANDNFLMQQDEISQMAFYNLCSRTFTQMYTGDPFSLQPFIHKIRSVQRMCQNDGHDATLLDAIMSHVSEFAADVLPQFPDSVESVINILTTKIKPDSSKVVRSRMMALKADRNNLTEFAKKVEQLSALLKRSLIFEKIPIDNANKMVVEDAVELCRSNTSAVLVEAGFVGREYANAKEVVAQYIIESRKDVEKKQILAFRQNSNSGRNGNNFQRRGNNFGNKKNNNNQNNGNFNRGGNQNQNRDNNRGNSRGRGNNNNNNNNYRGRNNNNNNNYYNGNRQQNRNIYHAENGSAPPSGAPNAQIVHSNQADSR